MPGYNETMLRGMQGMLPQAMGQRRLQQQQAQQEFTRRLQEAQLQRQYEVMGQQARHQAAQERQAQENSRRLWEQQNLTGRRLDLTETANRQRFEQGERAAAERARGTLKPGYAWDPQDQMKQVPAPGGPAWRDLSSKHAGDLQTLGTLDETTQAASATIDRILDPKKKAWGFEPNFGGYNAVVSQYLPGQTQDTRNDLENLKSTLKTYGLGLIRGSSGAVGSITEREWPILEKQIESLSPLMSEGEAKSALERIQARMGGMRQRALSLYKQEWGDSPFYKVDPLKVANPGGGAGAIPQGVDPRDWKYMTPEERALWTPQK